MESFFLRMVCFWVRWQFLKRFTKSSLNCCFYFIENICDCNLKTTNYFGWGNIIINSVEIIWLVKMPYFDWWICLFLNKVYASFWTLNRLSLKFEIWTVKVSWVNVSIFAYRYTFLSIDSIWLDTTYLKFQNLNDKWENFEQMEQKKPLNSKDK